MESNEKSSLKTKIRNYFKAHKLQGEILRFIICGGAATLIDMFVMGVVLYLFQPDNYPSFWGVFFNKSLCPPSTVSTVVGTGTGFLSGLIFNYIISVIFVFNEKGRSKTILGFLLFSLFSAIGLGIHLSGMYLCYDLLGINEWIVKIVLTVVVLIYNFVTRKWFLFRDKKEEIANE